MLAITARIELEPKDVSRYIAGAEKVIEPTRAESGCQLYAIAADITQSNVFWISEQWESESALLQHLQTPHITEFLAFCATVEITDMNIVKYEVSSAGPLELS